METFHLIGRIDGTNAESVGKAIQDAYSQQIPEELILDAENLDYISSAGLRVLLRLRKKTKRLCMLNVQPQVYEILELTGFNEMIEAEKALRKVNIEGCELIGQGAHGKVYRIDPETVIKVYNDSVPMDKIKQERELARWAFVRDIPTAIPYDIVRAGNNYGAVFELLDARSSAEYVNRSPEHLNSFIERSISLLKEIHSVEVQPGELPDMKQKTAEWIESLSGSLPEPVFTKLRCLIDEVPESHTLLHADYHLKNIMICGEDLMLIDMDTLCMGDPVFDLGTIYNSYHEFPSIDPEGAAFLGLDVETAETIYRKTFDLYLEDRNEMERSEIEKKAQLFGCARIIAFMNKLDGHPVKERAIEKCLQDITALLEF